MNYIYIVHFCFSKHSKPSIYIHFTKILYKDIYYGLHIQNTQSKKKHSVQTKQYKVKTPKKACAVKLQKMCAVKLLH